MQQRFTQINFGPMDHDRFVIVLDKGRSDQFGLLDDADAITAAAYCAIGASVLFFLPKDSFAVMDVFRTASEMADPRFVFNYQVHNNRKKYSPSAEIAAVFAEAQGEIIISSELLPGLSGEIKLIARGFCHIECPPGSGIVLIKSGCNPATQDAFCDCTGSVCDVECRTS